jgi:hypothetical protein
MEKKKNVKKKDAPKKNTPKKYEKPVLVRFDVPPATGACTDGSGAVV